MQFKRRHILALCIAFVMLSAEAQSTEKVAPLFADEHVLVATLEINISSVNSRRKQRNAREIDGRLNFSGIDGTMESVDVAVRPRGNYRRLNCKNPPIRLNFKQKQAAGTLFDGQDKVKLVRPCRDTSIAEQWVVLEYLAYKSYALLTPESFAVRALNLSYQRDGRPNARDGHFAFLIEDEEAMAARNEASIFKGLRTSRQTLAPLATGTLEMFQLLIGNNDYSVIRAKAGERCCHNVRLLQPAEGPRLRPVPYDFDFAGLVSADYAQPPPGYPIRRVRSRYFRGFCQPPQVWQTSAEHFASIKASLLELFETFPALSERTRRTTLAYIQDFYGLLNDPERLQSRVIDRCR